MRCEGWRRYGGAFTLGPVQWVQCKSKAICRVKVKQDDGVKILPACQVCLDEARLSKDIEVQAVLPLPVTAKKKLPHEAALERLERKHRVRR